MREKTLREMTPEEQAEAYRKVQEEAEQRSNWWEEKIKEYKQEKNYPFTSSGDAFVIKSNPEGDKYEFQIATGFVRGVGNWVHKHSSVARWIDKRTLEINDYFLAQMFNEACEASGAMCIYESM